MITIIYLMTRYKKIDAYIKHDNLPPIPVTRKYVRLGEYNTEDDIDCIYNSSQQLDTDCADAPINVRVQSVHVPDYNPNTFANDIALVRLAEDVQFSGFIKPICLPRSAADSGLVAGNNVTVAGWGHTDLCEFVSQNF